ncbi:hypothetical protein VTI28DRAFT_5308 [Corynascus sepedonium]
MRRLFNRWSKAATDVAAATGEPDLQGQAVTTASSSTKTFPSGIKLLHDPEHATVDVVFIHGLTGDREATWTARGASEPWPKVLLPSELPTARILTFGYDARVVDWRGVVSQSRIGNHAWNLLTSLATFREKDETNERPIIFICHSLGGLVCEDALLTSRQRPESHLQNILQSTRAIAFLGTPHHGVGLARWAELLSRHIGLVKQTNTEIVAILRRESEVLARIQDGFHTMVMARSNEGQGRIDITCFFEELPLPGVGQVVPQHSATLPGYIPIGIHSNHMDMARFVSADDAGFTAVCGELRRWTKQMGAAERRHDNGPAPKSVPKSVQNPKDGQDEHTGSTAHVFVPHTSNSDTTVNQGQPRRPATRADFEIAIICALPIEADAVDALFDHHWDDNGPAYDKAAGDSNAYSVGAIGRHNVVLAHMPGMGKANAAAVAANCRASFPNIKLAVVVGICGAVPFGPDGDEIILGDVIISDGVVQYDFGRRLPERFVRKDTLLDALGRPSVEVRALLAKLKGLRGRKMLRDSMAGYMEALRAEPELAADYPGIGWDRLFEPTYRHIGDGKSCEECGCNGKVVPRRRLGQGSPQPVVHFGLIASGDAVMKSGEDRDTIALQEGIMAFEMESAGVWDNFPCVVIKGACDYADSHKTKAWQRYAAATAAACMKAFLGYWVPYLQPAYVQEQPAGPWFLVPYPRNDGFVGRTAILRKLQQTSLQSASQARIALYGLAGIGKSQIALEFTYWLQETYHEVSVFWVHASNAERFRQAYASIAQECQVPGYDDPQTDVLPLLKEWLERKHRGRWLMVIDNADDMEAFFGQQTGPKDGRFSSHEGNLGRFIPECSRGAILVTTRNLQTGSRLTKGKRLIEVGMMERRRDDRAASHTPQHTRRNFR